jgi:hypothetical protein
MSPLTPISSPTHCISRQEIGVSRFFSFLRAAFEVASGGATPRTQTQKTIVNNRDYCLPFRQLGPSKRIVLDDPEGPFSNDRLTTREGFFDALLFRLITQASPLLLQDRRVCFGSLEEFKRTTKDVGEDYYCIPNATGQHCRYRNISHVSTYWDRSAGWDGIVANTKLTIRSLWDWLIGKEGRESRFFGMGPLVGWLLASDYASAGLVDMPQPSEVGGIIFDINAGARAGLGLLGYDVRSKEACAEAMRSLWSEVTESFTGEEIDEMGLDPITLEHALCKLKRLEKIITQVCNSSLHAVSDFTSFLKDDELDEFM